MKQSASKRSNEVFMALQVANLKKAHQDIKDLVFGYIRESNKCIIPLIINYFCLKYFWETDEWDITKIGLLIIKNKKTILLNKNSNFYNSAYLSRICDVGIYHWKFKIKQISMGWNIIGIWEQQNSNRLPPTSTYFTDTRLGGNNFGMDISSGYLVCPSSGGHYLGYSPSSCATCKLSKYSKRKRYCRGCINGDIIEMHLDFIKLELRFSINDNDFGKAFEIKFNSKYRAAICFQKGPGCEMKLLSFCNFNHIQIID